MDYREVALLNPSYKRGVITATATAPRRLILPQVRANKFSALYDALNNDTPMPLPLAPVAYASAANVEKQQSIKTPSYHTIKRGETLADIADMAGVEVQDLKAWNNLHTNRAVVGKRLRLSENTGNDESATEKKVAAKKYVTYKVRKGDTLSTVADKFEASMDEIKEMNGLKKSKLQPGMTLRISKV